MIYKSPLGSIYHLSTTYILPIGWLYISPTTYSGNQKQLLIYSYVLGQGAFRFSSTRRQAWRINALGHPSRLKALLASTKRPKKNGCVVISNIYLVLHPRSVANEIPTKTTYLTQKLRLWFGRVTFNKSSTRQKNRCGFWFLWDLHVSAFWLFKLGENKGPSWMVEVAQVGLFFFSWLVDISELVKFFNFMVCFLDLYNYIDKLPNRPWPMRFLGSWIFQGESRVILM